MRFLSIKSLGKKHNAVLFLVGKAKIIDPEDESAVLYCSSQDEDVLLYIKDYQNDIRENLI